MFETLRSVMQFRAFERDPVLRRLRKAANVADLRSIARRRMPRGVFDYIDGGAGDERALQRNSTAFADWELRPRVLRDMAKVDTSTTLFGDPLPMPLILSPTGFTRIADPQGELAVARAAARAGIPYTLSTLATRSVEEVTAVSTGPKWFQVYVWRDRGLTADLLDRAGSAGYDAIVITVDTAVLGRRERDIRRGFSLPPKLGPGTIIDGILHPGWTWDFVRAEPIRFANVAGRVEGDGANPVSLAGYIGDQFDPGLAWSDLDWFRERWKGRIVLKGIQTVEDAVIAADAGVDAIALSNHGGRQLDDAPSPISLVAPVADAVGDRVPVLCDGGVRRGSDIVKAVALGATACMAGRAYLYGLGAGGERGVDKALEMLRLEMANTMALVGCDSVDGLDRSYLRHRG